MRMIKVDGHRVCLVRTAGGVHAVDHACPHEGYGLTQGELNGDLLTCAWHNWKFRVTDGTCVQGEEGVTVHRVDVDDVGDIRVTITRPDPEVVRARTLVSLRRGIANDYTGQVARDVVRLLQASAEPRRTDLGGRRPRRSAGRVRLGPLDRLGDRLPVDDRPVRRRPARPADRAGDHGHRRVGTRSAGQRVARARPRRRSDPARRSGRRSSPSGRRDAQALVLAAIERGDTADDLRRWFTAVVSDHLLSYGHGAIYAQKAFELLAMIGWERAATVLPHLVPTIVYGTREDKLPYMRPFVRGLDSIDLAALASVPVVDGWTDDGALRSTLLGNDRRAALDSTVAALRDGAGIDGVLDTVVHVVSDRMLRYDTAGEFDFADDFGWLDITHGLTYASAARWHHDQAMSRDAGTTPDLVRLALYTAFLAQWTGRHEWHTRVGEEHDVEPLGPDLDSYGRELQRTSLLDGTSAFIVHAHAVKTSRAASVEAARLDSVRPLDATARFMAAPKLERFVAATVERSIDFLNGRTPRD